MNKQKAIRDRRILRHKRVRSVVTGTKEMPRLSVARSLKNVNVQIIDDVAGKTLLSVFGTGKETVSENPYQGKIAAAYAAGFLIGKKAVEAGIEKIAFDRGGYAYHGRVKAIAEGARAAGLKF